MLKITPLGLPVEPVFFIALPTKVPSIVPIVPLFDIIIPSSTVPLPLALTVLFI